MPTIGSLFSGYGGLDLAVEEVFSARTAWVSDIDPGPCKILAHRFPDAPNLGDITKVKWAPDCPRCGRGLAVYRRDGGVGFNPEPFYYCYGCHAEWETAIRFDDPDAERIPEPVEIVAGGSPCQDISNAGRRAGMREGTRSNLWVEMREAIAVLRPTYVVWENVSAAASTAADSSLEPCPRCVGDPGDRGPVLRALGRVLGDLASLGYDAGWYGLRAADVGACHGRFRYFVLAADTHDAGRREQWRPVTVRAELDTTERARNVPADTSGIRYQRGWPSRDGRTGSADGDRGPVICRACGHEDFRHHWYSMCDGTLSQPACICEFTPKEVQEQPEATIEDGWPHESLPNVGHPGQHRKRSDVRVGGDLLLPTSRATDGTKGGPNQRGSSGDLMLPSAVAHLLPTPAAGNFNDGESVESWEARRDRMKERHGNGNGMGTPLGMAVKMLPTPTTEPQTGNGHARNLGAEVQRFGQYAAAVASQERALGRPAPPPTEPGPKGNPRLSGRFTEWMMGAPDGWICDVPGITRNEVLKACGNGVYTPQAVHALRALLEQFEQTVGGAA